MNSSWGDLEEAALQGLAWLAQIIYLRGLRRYMDYTTGLVGIARGISRRSLAETAYLEPEPGRHSKESGLPTPSAIRNSLKALEKAGLIEPRGTDKRLVFFLPLASRGQSVKKSSDRGATEERPTPATEGATDLSPAVARDTEEGATEGAIHRIIPKGRSSDPPQLSVVRNSKTSTEREADSQISSQEKKELSLSGDGSRLGNDWSLPEDWRQDALALRPDWTPRKAQAVSDKFRDYWTSRPGKDGLSTNWRAVWRNWVRREEDRNHAGNRANPPDQRAAIAAKIDADARAAAAELMGSAPFRQV